MSEQSALLSSLNRHQPKSGSGVTTIGTFKQSQAMFNLGIAPPKYVYSVTLPSSFPWIVPDHGIPNKQKAKGHALLLIQSTGKSRQDDQQELKELADTVIEQRALERARRLVKEEEAKRDRNRVKAKPLRFYLPPPRRIRLCHHTSIRNGGESGAVCGSMAQ